ncbi:hypothetical protein N0V88_001476 [Collariella sp. IMI 366227]|nr:hypothetical protein N0V88_001476 [Collariella sp. IMI 366227]
MLELLKTAYDWVLPGGGSALGSGAEQAVLSTKTAAISALCAATGCILPQQQPADSPDLPYYGRSPPVYPCPPPKA